MPDIDIIFLLSCRPLLFYFYYYATRDECFVAVLIGLIFAVTRYSPGLHSSLPRYHRSGAHSSYRQMSTRKEDPRDPSQEVTLTFPKTWYQESSGLSTPLTRNSSMLFLTNRWSELIWNAPLRSYHGDS